VLHVPPLKIRVSALRDTLQRAMSGFQWKRFRKSYAMILMTAGNDDTAVNRLMRHSARGKNTSIAAKHYIGRSDCHLRDLMDEAFAPYGAMLTPAVWGGAQEAANATA
jgi:hypothetical protein